MTYSTPDDYIKKAYEIFKKIDNERFIELLTKSNERFREIKIVQEFINCRCLDIIHKEVQDLQERVPDEIKRNTIIENCDVDLIDLIFVKRCHVYCNHNINALYRYLCAFNVIYNKLNKEKALHESLKLMCEIHHELAQTIAAVPSFVSNSIDMEKEMKKNPRIEEIFHQLVEIVDDNAKGHNWMKKSINVDDIITCFDKLFKGSITSLTYGDFGTNFYSSITSDISDGMFDKCIEQKFIPFITNHRENVDVKTCKYFICDVLSRHVTDISNLAKRTLKYQEFNHEYINFYNYVIACINDLYLMTVKNSRPKDLSRLLVGMMKYFNFTLKKDLSSQQDDNDDEEEDLR